MAGAGRHRRRGDPGQDRLAAASGLVHQRHPSHVDSVEPGDPRRRSSGSTARPGAVRHGRPRLQRLLARRRPDDQAYTTWINSVATTIGTTHAIVILEPDALADVVQGCAAAHASERYALLRNAVTVLEQHLGVSVYLDAGSPGFPSNVTALASALKQSGIDAAQGFALNVSNFYAPSTVSTYGQKLSAALGGAHFVIDTSRDGAGPLPANSGYKGPSWCNPPGRKLGPPPTTTTPLPTLDAYLWIKTPGASDGTCDVGDPPAGKWWLQYAMGLAGA